MENSRLLNSEQIAGIMGGEAMEVKAAIDNAITYQAEPSEYHKAMANNVMSQGQLHQHASEHDIYEALIKVGIDVESTKLLADLLHRTGYTNEQTGFLNIVIDFHNKIKTRNKRDSIKQSTNSQTIGDVVVKQMMADRARIIAMIRSHMHDDTLEAIDRAIRLTEKSLDFDTLDYHLLDEIKQDIAKGYLPRGVLLAELMRPSTALNDVVIGPLFPGEVFHDLVNSAKMTEEADSSQNTENTLSEDNDK